MTAHAIQIDATRLFYRQFLLPRTGSTWFDATQVQTVTLEQGSYSIQVQSGVYTDVWFTVTPQGTIDFDAAFDALASGRGTALLMVAGLEVSLDASELVHDNGGGVLFASMPMGSDGWIVQRTCRLLPQQGFLVQQGSGVVCNLMFALGIDGRFAYDASQDVMGGGCLSGAGTSTLRFHGTPVVVDVSAVSRLLTLPDVAGLTPTWSGTMTLRVLPADFFRVQIDQGVTGSLFALGARGTVTLAAPPAGMRLALDTLNGMQRIRALPPAPPEPGPLTDASDDFVRFKIVVGSDATGPQQVSMVMRSGRVAWRVDRRWFPGQPTLVVQRRLIGPRRSKTLTVTLAGARFPGTDLPADFDLAISRINAPDGVEVDVQLGWAFGAGRYETDVSYDGTASATLAVSGRICTAGADQALAFVAGVHVTVGFRPGGLSIAAPQLAALSGGGSVQPVSSLELALLAPAERVLFDADVAPPLHCRLALGTDQPWPVALPSLHTPVGDLRSVADRFDRLLAEVGENLDGRRRQVLQYAARSRATQFQLTLGGGLADTAGRPVVAALAGATLTWFYDGTPPRAELRAQASTGAVWLPLRRVALRLGALRRSAVAGGNFGVAFDLGGSRLLACDLPTMAMTAAPADCVPVVAAVSASLSILPAGATPDPARHRNWLRLGATVVDADLLLRDIALALQRPQDLTVLQLAFADMALSVPARGAAVLAPAVAGRGGVLVATLPPQHLVEPSFPGELPMPPVAARLAEPSRLGFVIPPGGPAIDLDGGLLDWSGFAPVLNQPLVDNPPTPWQTVIELPYRLWLSPRNEAGWTSWPPVPPTGRVALATTRLGLRRSGPAGAFVDERASADTLSGRRLRAIGSPDYVAGILPPDPIANVMNAGARRDIVAQTSLTDVEDGLIECRRLMLGALGGWLEAEGYWDPPPKVDEVAHWMQHVAMGRDERVLVARRGWLCPWGHRSVRVAVAERHFGGGPGGDGQNSAWLIEREYLLVPQRVCHYPGRRDLPFTEVEMLLAQTPALAADLAPYSAGTGPTVDNFPFWVYLRDEHGGPDRPMRFPMHLRGIDVSDDPRGDVVESSAMAIFVPDGLTDAQIDEVVATYNRATGNGWQDFRNAPRPIAFAPPSAGGHARLDTLGLQFEAARQPTVAGNSAAGGPASVLPTLAGARVRLTDVAQMAHLNLPAGSDGGVDISYFAGYLAGDDASGVFANVLPLAGPNGVPVPVALQFGGAGGSSGLATPDMVITGLSQRHGPLGGDLGRLAAGVPRFDPADFFGNAAPQLFGGVGLLDLLTLVEGPAALDAAPRLVTRRSGAQVETTYDWTPHVQSSDRGLVTVKFDDPAAGQPGGAVGPIRLHSSLKLRPSADPESEITATVEDFRIGFADLVSVGIRRMALTQRSGAKPQVDFTLAEIDKAPLRLGDKIDFLQPLLDTAQKLLGRPPAVDLSNGVVRIGYALQPPNLTIGVFSLENIRIGVGLAIPLGGQPVAFDFNFGEKDHHFLVTVAFIGGGGFFAIEVDAHGPRSIELAVEVAASVALDLGVASGSAHVAVGVYVHYTGDTTEIAGYVRAGGELTVLGILSLHVELYLGLTYQSTLQRKVIWGEASLMVEVSIGCLSKSVTLSMRREFVVGGGARRELPVDAGMATRLGLAADEPLAFGNSRDEWQAYFAAFA